MTDYQDKYRERWQTRRKAAYNWKKLILMVLALVGIIILLNQISKFGTSKTKPAAETIIQQPSAKARFSSTNPSPA